MKNETAYDRYRREEEELMKQLEETRRAAHDAGKRERTRQELRERGVLDSFEASLAKIRTGEIRWQRKHGKSIQDARLWADGVIERVWKGLSARESDDRVGADASARPSGEDPAESNR